MFFWKQFVLDCLLIWYAFSWVKIHFDKCQRVWKRVMVSSMETARLDVNWNHEFASRIADIARGLGKDACYGAGSSHPVLAREPNSERAGEQAAQSGRENAGRIGQTARAVEQEFAELVQTALERPAAKAELSQARFPPFILWWAYKTVTRYFLLKVLANRLSWTYLSKENT